MKGYNTIIIESLPCISLAILRKLGFFRIRDEYKELSIGIKSKTCIGEEVKYSMLIGVSNQDGSEYVRFKYFFNEEEVEYIVPLVKVNNVLTKGDTYYFCCIENNKKCRKLYLYDKHFISRTAIPNSFYYRDTLSKKERALLRMIRRIKTLEKTMSIGAEKHFKATYGGFDTRKQHIINNAYRELNKTLEEYRSVIA